MEDPLLGTLTYDDAHDGYVSEAKPIRFLGGHPCSFVLVGYDGDPRPEEFHAAVRNALDASRKILTAAQAHVLRYCKDMLALHGAGGPKVKLEKPSDVWAHVQFGDELYVRRRAKNSAEDGVYLSLECNCDWEVEHGLQLVWREGREISKVGPFNGHLTNAAAYADPALIGVVYKRLGAPRRR